MWSQQRMISISGWRLVAGLAWAWLSMTRSMPTTGAELGTWSELGPSLGWHHHQETGDRNLKVRLGPAAECWPGYIQASAPPGDSWENMDGSHILIQDIYKGGRNGQAYCDIEMVHSQYECGQDNLSSSRSSGRGCALVCCLRPGKQTLAALRAGSHQQNAR